jgi:hypothetical protein
MHAFALSIAFSLSLSLSLSHTQQVHIVSSSFSPACSSSSLAYFCTQCPHELFGRKGNVDMHTDTATVRDTAHPSEEHVNIQEQSTSTGPLTAARGQRSCHHSSDCLGITAATGRVRPQTMSCVLYSALLSVNLKKGEQVCASGISSCRAHVRALVHGLVEPVSIIHPICLVPLGPTTQYL